MLVRSIVLLFSTVIVSAHVHLFPFADGDEFHIECKNHELEWEEFFVCSDTNASLPIKFAHDDFIHCGWMIHNEDEYVFMKTLVSRQELLSCRVPLSKDRSTFIPLGLPFWGFVEATHIHVNVHWNFVFHADQGLLMAASVYSVRDQFQMVRPGTTIGFHGAIRWFHRHDFNKLVHGHSHRPTGSQCAQGVSTSGVVLWCLCTGILTAGVLGVVFKVWIRPNIIRKFLKVD